MGFFSLKSILISKTIDHVNWPYVIMISIKNIVKGMIYLKTAMFTDPLYVEPSICSTPCVFMSCVFLCLGQKRWPHTCVTCDGLISLRNLITTIWGSSSQTCLTEMDTSLTTSTTGQGSHWLVWNVHFVSYNYLLINYFLLDPNQITDHKS